MNRHLTISLPSGLYRRYRNSTGSVPVSRESRTVTAGREFHPALRISVQRYGKVLSMQEISVKTSPHIKKNREEGVPKFLSGTLFSERSAQVLFGLGRIHHDFDEIAGRDDVADGLLHVFCIDVSDGSFVFLVEIDSVFLEVYYVAHPV